MPELRRVFRYWKMPDQIKNEAQERAIHHESGPMLVIAGPGSGKTFVITHRIQFLIREKKIPPSKILVITFTKAAALEMRARAISLEKDCAYVQFGTFHSIFFSILKKIPNYQNVKLVNEKQKNACILMFLKEVFREERDAQMALESAGKAISFYKNTISELTEREGLEAKLTAFLPGMKPEQIIRLITDYDSWLKENSWIDFDDMLLCCRTCLKESASFQSFWKSRFSHILIDEFQDINQVQYETIQMLVSDGNIMAVGDDDQSIYGFRGSNPRFMEVFLDDFKAEKVELFKNYRCSKDIVKKASDCISHNKKRFEKQLVAAQEWEEPVLIHAFDGKDKMADYICRQIESHKDSTHALLVRTNSQASFYIQYFRKKGIDVIGLVEKREDNNEMILEDLKAYMRFAQNKNRSDFLKIMNRPVRYIKRSLVAEEKVDLKLLQKRLQDKPWIAERVKLLEAQFNMLKKLDLYGALHFIWKGMGYEGFLTEELKTEEAIKKSKQYFEQILRYARTHEDLQDINRKYETLEKSNLQISVMTFHGAKGLEFDQVFLPELNRGKVPHGRMLDEDEIEEERRMFYVAMTRAKRLLHLLYIEKDHANEKDVISPFLAEIIAKKDEDEA